MLSYCHPAKAPPNRNFVCVAGINDWVGHLEMHLPVSPVFFIKIQGK
jgi:hypothetical protein